MKVFKKSENGITLIALVITIIVLLILAGITIATLSGENGILTRASEAKHESKKAEYKEILDLIGMEIRPEQVTEKLSSKEYMDRYQKKIEDNSTFKEAIIKRKNDTTIQVVTKEGYIYIITDEEVKYLGDRNEYPETPELQEGDIIFDYSPKTFTKDNVTVSITTPKTGFKIQYFIGEPDENSQWLDYDNNQKVTMTDNGLICARLINALEETNKTPARKNITNIDRNPPIVNVSSGSVTYNSIQVNVSVNEQSGKLTTSNTYQYYLNGSRIQIENTDGTKLSSSYTFTGLLPETQYKIEVVVTDEAGNSNTGSATIGTSAATIDDLKGGPIFPNSTKVADGRGKKVAIPGGFKISSDSGRIVEQGIVIEDNLGNQFVWIPVNKESDFAINTRIPSWRRFECLE